MLWRMVVMAGIALLASGILYAQDKEDIPKLIVQLGDDDPVVREAATDKLISVGAKKQD